MDKRADNKERKCVKIKWAPILIVGFFSLFLLLGLYIVGLKHIGGENYLDSLKWFEDRFGIKLAVFLYTYVVDTLILPLSPDLVWVVAATLPPIEAIFLVGIASALGGATSYYIGVLFYKLPIVRKLTGKAYEKWGIYIKSYGITFLILASMLPLPFSTICSVAGAIKLPAKKVIPVCLFRFVRATIYFFLFRAGLLLI